MKCKQCKISFTPIPQAKKGIFCSHDCHNVYQRVNTREQYLKNPKRCIFCDDIISYRENIKVAKFCNRSCGAKYNNKRRTECGYTPSHKKWSSGKISAKMSSKMRRADIKSSVVFGDFTIITFAICNITNKPYVLQTPHGGIKQISPYIKSSKQIYYEQAKFRFNVYDYPDIFDITLLEKYGWYTCPGKKRKNQKKNINGVSRDHIISINDGFKNGYDPYILAHPANCRLIKQVDNVKKLDKSNMSYDELLINIKQWNG